MISLLNKEINKLKFNYPVIIFIAYIILHLLFLNINAAEWGDSYRILRASNFIQQGTYPDDEKRPPLYSFVLSIRPVNIDAILWGRIFMFGVSVVFFWVFYAFLCLYTENVRIKALSLLLLALNPVFFYWSIRIYADVFFALLVLMSMYLLKRVLASFKWKYAVLLGLVCGLSIITRFEGYLLTFAIISGLLLCNVTDLKRSVKRIYKEKTCLLAFFSSFLLIEIPYFIFRNPFTSKYFDETSRRLVSIESVLIYAASLLFVFGFINAFGFLAVNYREIPKISKLNVSLIIFIGLELLLAFLWPAAIPRLFVPIIPFLVIFVATSISKYFDLANKRVALKIIILSALLSAFYVVIQYFYKQQFLVNIKQLFVLILICQILALYSIYKFYFRLFVLTICFSMVLWLTGAVWVHKDVYLTLKEAAIYSANNLSGQVAFNDVSSLSDWYMNYNNVQRSLRGEYYNVSVKDDLDISKIQKNNIQYLIVTNEHNTSLNLGLDSKPYLHKVASFNHNIYGRNFWTYVFKVEAIK